MNGSTVYSSNSYDAPGQLSSEIAGTGVARYLCFDVTGKVTGVYADAAFTQPKVTFAYNELGQGTTQYY